MTYKLPFTDDRKYVYPEEPGDVESIMLDDNVLKWPGANPFDRIDSDRENDMIELYFFAEHEPQHESLNVVLRPHLRLHFAHVDGAKNSYDIWLAGADFTRAASKWRIGGTNTERIMSDLAHALVEGDLKSNVERMLKGLHLDYGENAIKFIEQNFTTKFQVRELAPGRWQIQMHLLDRGASAWSTVFELTSKHVDDLLAQTQAKAA